MTADSTRRFSEWEADDAFALTGAELPDDRQPLMADLARVALRAAQEAAEILQRGAPGQGAQVTGVDTKISSTDMVSDVDRASEAAVARVLAEARPDDAVLGEEGTARTGTSGVTWVVDPLDGTTNFLFGIPQWSVSIAAEMEGRAVVGLVIDPSRNELWASIAGHGAFLNGRRCVVRSDRSTLETALVATGFGYRTERRAWQARVAAQVIPAVRDIRRLGSAALDLCWTGAARFDAYYEWGLNPWDYSAGALFAAEAGAVVQILGDRTVVAAPPHLFDPFSRLLESAGALRAEPGPEPQNW